MFVVRRLAGLFTEVVVDWELSSLAGADLSPTSGVVTFADGQELGEIEIYAVPDEVKWYIYTGTDNFSSVAPSNV